MKTKILTTVAVGIMLTFSLTACGGTSPDVKPAPKPAATQSVPSTPKATEAPKPVATSHVPQGEQFLLTDSSSITYEGVTVTCPDVNAVKAVQLTIVNGDTANPVCEYPVDSNDEIANAINEAENG